MPANLPVDRRKRIFIGVIGSLQGDDRVDEQPECLRRFKAGIHVALLLLVVGLRVQPAHQLDKHHHHIVGELLAELDDLHHDRRAPTAGAVVFGKPGRRSITFANHLLPSPNRNASL